jgi:hypothetical protein
MAAYNPHSDRMTRTGSSFSRLIVGNDRPGARKQRRWCGGRGGGLLGSPYGLLLGVRRCAIIAVLWRAGLRISEALGLTESDLDQPACPSARCSAYCAAPPAGDHAAQ